jgi:hypothetical protein
MLTTGLVNSSRLPQRFWLQGWENARDYHKYSDYRAGKTLETTIKVLTTGLVQPSGLPQRFWLQGCQIHRDYSTTKVLTTGPTKPPGPNTKILTTGLVKPSETNSDVLTTELVKKSRTTNTEVLTTWLVKSSGLPQRFWQQYWYNPWGLKGELIWDYKYPEGQIQIFWLYDRYISSGFN